MRDTSSCKAKTNMIVSAAPIAKLARADGQIGQAAWMMRSSLEGSILSGVGRRARLLSALAR